MSCVLPYANILSHTNTLNLTINEHIIFFSGQLIPTNWEVLLDQPVLGPNVLEEGRPAAHFRLAEVADRVEGGHVAAAAAVEVVVEDGIPEVPHGQVLEEGGLALAHKLLVAERALEAGLLL